MNKRSDEFETIREIADAICDGNPQDEQLVELAVILEDNPEGQRFYLEYMDMNGRLLLQSDESKSLTISSFQPGSQSSSGDNVIYAEVLPPSKNYNRVWLLVIMMILLVSGIVIWMVSNKLPDDNFATVAQTEGVVDSSGKSPLAGDIIGSREYEVSKTISLNTVKGSKLLIEKGIFQFKKENTMVIEAEKLNADLKESFECLYPTFKLKSNNAGFKLQKDGNDYFIEVDRGELTVEPKEWQPVHYWPLDSLDDTTPNMASNVDGIVIGEITREKGIVGEGAANYTNAQGQNIMIRSNEKTALGAGAFGVRNGVTIEALIKSKFVVNYRGKDRTKKLDNDVIFRKDKDFQYRILLALQNDRNSFTYPKVADGSVLSFGLYLVGHDYHELEVLIEPKEGQKDVSHVIDGKAHHIVATYNSQTGLKAIYVDGELARSHQYPPGTIILGGGPGNAMIGNTPQNNLNEPFHGMIDEVAYYNFALPEAEIKQHYLNFKKELNYYGNKPVLDKNISKQKRIIHLKAGESMRLDSLRGLPK